MSELKRCSRCVLPSTWPQITFDSEGVCNICRNYEKKKLIDWDARQEILSKILMLYQDYAMSKGNKYDCLCGYSGGKDTVYTLWAAVKKYSMKPLCVTFDHGFNLSEEGEYNLKEIPRKLDVDHLRFSIGNGLRNALCRKASEVSGDLCWHCHNGVGAFPARVSAMFDIPLQIWGEPTGEYQTAGNAYTFDQLEEQNYEHYQKIFQAGVTSQMVLPDGYEITDLMPFQWPDSDWVHDRLKAIYLGNFEPLWNQEEHVKIIKQELGWRDYPKQETWQSWDKNDCPMELVREAQKKLRRGFGKASFAASKEIREGKITREQGMKLVEEYENKDLVGLDELCQEIGFNSFDELKNITNLRI